MIKLQWDVWFLGLFAAFVGGGANAIVNGVTNTVIAPNIFNIQHPKALLVSIGVSYILGGILSTALYLKQSPIPQIQTLTTTTTATLKQDPTSVEVKTVETKENK